MSMSKREALIAIVEQIVREAGYCEQAARKAGWSDADGIPYELTALDCESIVDAVKAVHGREPNSAEWRDAGYQRRILARLSSL